MQWWGGSCRMGRSCRDVMKWSCRGRVGHGGVGWVMVGWDGSWWGGSCRGGVGYVRRCIIQG